MKISPEALRALQQMMGEEGAFFMRNLPINRFPDRQIEKRCEIPWEIYISGEVFGELRQLGCIKLHIDSSWQQWGMTKVGKQALMDANMETHRGELTEDDLQWLYGTGRFAQ